MLNWEVLRLRRQYYFCISDCIALLNQKYLAEVFNEEEASKTLKKWCLEAKQCNQERRAHYIMDRYEEFIDTNKNTQLLMELFNIRKNEKI